MIIQKTTTRGINKLIDLRRSPEYINSVNKIVEIEFEKIKNKLISDFKRHPVTREIEAGPNGNNISKTLGGYGNLFTYIGFESKSKPIKPILRELNDIRLTKIIFSKNGNFNVLAIYPSIREIFDATPLPWAEGRSWAEGIEKGIPGLGAYLNKSSAKSRSGKGLQTKGEIRKSGFFPTTYISSMIKSFELDIMKLNRIKI